MPITAPRPVGRCFTGPVYGGTGWTGLSAAALAICLSVTLSACQEETAPSGAAREPGSATQVPGPGSDPVQAADYDTWQPIYRAVRAATEDDLLDLRERVDKLDASAYTVQVPTMGLEVARSPEHVRVSLGDGWELHLDPDSAGKELFDIGPFVLCSLDDDTCTEVGEDLEGGGGPHLFNNGLDTLLFTAGALVQAQEAAAVWLRSTDPDGASVAVVDSPAGPLDCLLTGGREGQHARLEGRPIELDADPFSSGRRRPLSTTCLDERGLLVLTLPSLLAPVVPYASFQEGVPDDFDQHAQPVPYGASASPQPTASATSDPEGMQDVLVAAEPIEAGESLADAQAAGRFELTFVPGTDLQPGAVSSTSALDGVALRDIAAGEQITADLFG
jgi:hypothetical protein